MSALKLSWMSPAPRVSQFQCLSAMPSSRGRTARNTASPAAHTSSNHSASSHNPVSRPCEKMPVEIPDRRRTSARHAPGSQPSGPQTVFHTSTCGDSRVVVVAERFDGTCVYGYAIDSGPRATTLRDKERAAAKFVARPPGASGRRVQLPVRDRGPLDVVEARVDRRVREDDRACRARRRERGARERRRQAAREDDVRVVVEDAPPPQLRAVVPDELSEDVEADRPRVVKRGRRGPVVRVAEHSSARPPERPQRVRRGGASLQREEERDLLGPDARVDEVPHVREALPPPVR
mmetsp:Transcript_2301/g.6567  ORF Transcript_2301/g.6567 Transcript_2301/m.6567 type:complete len:292 (+) Transcript_2301:490-1365(+)